MAVGARIAPAVLVQSWLQQPQQTNKFLELVQHPHGGKKILKKLYTIPGDLPSVLIKLFPRKKLGSWTVPPPALLGFFISFDSIIKKRLDSVRIWGECVRPAPELSTALACDLPRPAPPPCP